MRERLWLYCDEISALNFENKQYIFIGETFPHCLVKSLTVLVVFQRLHL